MIYADKFCFVGAPLVPAFFAYKVLMRAGSAAIMNPVAGAICTAVASAALAKLGERLEQKPYKAYVIPSIWIISSLLTTVTQFPLRFITAVAPIITVAGAVALIVLASLGIFYQTNMELRKENSAKETLGIEMKLINETPEDFLEVITSANRVLGDIAQLNSERGTTKFTYKTDGNRKDVNEAEMRERTKRDNEAAIAALHQKIVRHIEGMGVTLSDAKHVNCGLRDRNDLKRTFHTYSQALIHSKTKKVIASTIFHINHTDESTFPLMSKTVNGKLVSEIVMNPFEAVS